MAATDATPIPVKNQAYRVTFPILDADGDLVSGATGLDSEISKDGGTFVDCTNEATEIAAGSGMYFLDITATEMNADTVAIIVKTTSSGAKTTPMILYPNKSGGLAVNVTAWAGTATATTNLALKTTLAKTTDITGFNDLSAAQVNTECDTALSDVGVTTTVTGRIDAAVSTRATPAQVQTELGTYGALKPTTAGRTLDVTTTGEAGIDWNNIGAPTTTQNLSGTTISTSQAVASVSGAVGSVTGAVTVGTNNDKTGYALTSGERTSIATAIWNTLTSALTTVGSIGKLLVDNIDAKISSITGGGGATDWTAPERDQIRHRLGIDGTATAPSTGTPSLAKPGDAMALTSVERTTLASAIWNVLTSALTTAGSIGKLLVDNINATISSRSTYAGADTAGTTTLLSRIGSTLNITAGKVDVNDKSGFSLTTAYDPAKSAASQASVDTLTGYVDTEISSIKGKTDQLTFGAGGVNAEITLDAGDLANLADAVLKRDWTLVSGEAAYSLLNAARMLRNKWDTAGGTLTVRKEDGTTTAWTRTLTTDPTAQPITGAS